MAFSLILKTGENEAVSVILLEAAL